MNTYARKIALESGIIRMTELMPGDSIFCRHTGNRFKFEPSRITKIESLFRGKIIRLTHEGGAATEHSFDAYAKLA
jgi:hypothetical protein